MMARHREQLTELLTNYGKIAMVCLDINLGDKVWKQLRETMIALRKIQPDVMFRNRGIGAYGDYETPERVIPGDSRKSTLPWFVIYPLAKNFDYDPRSEELQGRGMDYPLIGGLCCQRWKLHGRDEVRAQMADCILRLLKTSGQPGHG